MNRDDRGMRLLAAATVVALLGVVGASAASAAPPAGVSMEGTGKPPAGLGLFSSAALVQKGCAENGRTTFTYAGSGPWCVNPWPAGKKNGGATAQGVTATKVNVVAYLPNTQMLGQATAAGPQSQATKEPAPLKAVMEDWQAVYKYAAEKLGAFQLWGRGVALDLVTASGPDETAQRADAVAVIAKKPFMVVDLTATSTGGANVFSTLVARAKIVTVSASTNVESATEQAPYRWNYGADPSSTPPLTAAFVGKSLTGKKAQWAGDKTLQTKTRTFGAIYPTVDFDLAAFERALGQNGGKLSEKLGFDPADSQGTQQQVATFVGRLKSSGITSVVLLADPPTVSTIMKTATGQDYFPEWIYTGFGYQDYGLFARSNDEQQMPHAFGLGVLGPAVTGSNPSLAQFQWYWGTTQGNTWSIASGLFEFVYNALHYAGPTLTAANVQKGLFAAPARETRGVANGLSGYGKTVGLPYNEFALFGADRALIWWDGNQQGPTQATNTDGKGVFEFLNEGKNVGYADFTKTEPKFFDKGASVFQLKAADLYPGGVEPQPTPCPDCPVNGGSPS